MTAASCSPAVASRRAKYVDEFRVPTLLVAHRTFFLKQPTHNFFPDGSSRLYSAVPERGACSHSHQSPRRSQEFRFGLTAKSAKPPCSVAAFVVNTKHRAHRGTSLGPLVCGSIKVEISFSKSQEPEYNYNSERKPYCAFATCWSQ